jgi:hypothetical protein
LICGALVAGLANWAPAFAEAGRVGDGWSAFINSPPEAHRMKARKLGLDQ